MTHIKTPLLAFVFMDPNTTMQLNSYQWDLLIRQARKAGVLARLASQLEHASLISSIPPQALQHFRSAQIYAEQFKMSLRWEIHCIESTFSRLNVPVILLKGGAYEIAENNAAVGRVFSDIDILVAKQNLKQVESAMMLNGWMPGKLDQYDRRYYRQWMHEIPPLTHVTRKTTIDVHHNILPETCKSCPDADKLLRNTIEVNKNIFILSEEDRVLHSATHLFYEGELDHGFRDISDLDLLFREFSSKAGFWQKLFDRARELKQQVPLFYALRYTCRLFATPIPRDVLNASENMVQSKIKQTVMDFLYLRALLPDHASCEDSWTGLARWLLYVRSHWLRMPVYLLIPHLLRKGFMRIIEKSQR